MGQQGRPLLPMTSTSRGSPLFPVTFLDGRLMDGKRGDPWTLGSVWSIASHRAKPAPMAPAQRPLHAPDVSSDSRSAHRGRRHGGDTARDSAGPTTTLPDEP